MIRKEGLVLVILLFIVQDTKSHSTLTNILTGNYYVPDIDKTIITITLSSNQQDKTSQKIKDALIKSLHSINENNQDDTEGLSGQVDKAMYGNLVNGDSTQAKDSHGTLTNILTGNFFLPNITKSLLILTLSSNKQDTTSNKIKDALISLVDNKQGYKDIITDAMRAEKVDEDCSSEELNLENNKMIDSQYEKITTGGYKDNPNNYNFHGRSDKQFEDGFDTANNTNVNLNEEEALNTSFDSIEIGSDESLVLVIDDNSPKHKYEYDTASLEEGYLRVNNSNINTLDNNEINNANNASPDNFIKEPLKHGIKYTNDQSKDVYNSLMDTHVEETTIKDQYKTPINNIKHSFDGVLESIVKYHLSKHNNTTNQDRKQYLRNAYNSFETTTKRIYNSSNYIAEIDVEKSFEEGDSNEYAMGNNSVEDPINVFFNESNRDDKSNLDSLDDVENINIRNHDITEKNRFAFNVHKNDKKGKNVENSWSSQYYRDSNEMNKLIEKDTKQNGYIKNLDPFEAEKIWQSGFIDPTLGGIDRESNQPFAEDESNHFNHDTIEIDDWNQELDEHKEFSDYSNDYANEPNRLDDAKEESKNKIDVQNRWSPLVTDSGYLATEPKTHKKDVNNVDKLAYSIVNHLKNMDESENTVFNKDDYTIDPNINDDNCTDTGNGHVHNHH